ncbi:MAG TPA: LytTR family DNA-binding domain-containing protein [Flavobacterium sp.]|uniref:LytR/AlgR family response regulator transcription factor n=1 Tax=unclassified Flavobacterium TaxID=196869 RepID=UPI0025C08951|nr:MULTISPECIES: LytTR family DNA-binding domain-containing protein [unclassified Flavobacterium]HRE76403.1 LytTR family DNA-binding domain-containing protein [Flavobacterium sp.]
MNYSYIIIEDQKECLEHLQNELKNYPEFICLGIASSVNDGIVLTLTQKPNIIFLDVELNDGIGFEILRETNSYFNEPPFVIVISEFEKYAKKAINYDMLFYLDKPINSVKLTIAINKFKKRISELKNHISIKDKTAHWLVKHESILYIQSDGSYCNIHRLNDKKITVTKPMKEIENLLPKTFLRCHKSYIVNINYIEKMNTTLKIIMLHAKTGVFEITEKSKMRLDEIFTIKDTILEIPIGEVYLEKVKHTLLTSKNL